MMTNDQVMQAFADYKERFGERYQIVFGEVMTNDDIVEDIRRRISTGEIKPLMAENDGGVY